MYRHRTLLLVFLLAVLALPLAACTARTQAPAATTAQVDRLPGVTAYYELLATHHRREVRKPIRDQREWAQRRLAESADKLLAESQGWDSDARLVAIAEPERPAARAAVADFRESLRELSQAARGSSTAGIHAAYGRTLTAYRQVNVIIAPAE